MKRVLIFSFALLFVVGGLSVSFAKTEIDCSVMPDSFENSAMACKYFMECGFPPFADVPDDITVGECVSFFETMPVLECKDYEANSPDLFYLEYKNLGDCIHDFSLMPPPPPD